MFPTSIFNPTCKYCGDLKGKRDGSESRGGGGGRNKEGKKKKETK